MKRYTIADIVAANEAAGRFYFSKDTLRFFGQTRGMFKVRHVAGRVFVIAPSRWDGRLMGYSLAEFDPATGELNKPKEMQFAPRTKLATEDFFDSLKQKEAVAV
jgi:hypothetical protein